MEQTINESWRGHFSLRGEAGKKWATDANDSDDDDDDDDADDDDADDGHGSGALHWQA